MYEPGKSPERVLHKRKRDAAYLAEEAQLVVFVCPVVSFALCSRAKALYSKFVSVGAVEGSLGLGESAEC